ncbi:MAG TPA: DUF6111 family protein [Stellaceae bacterium]|jgi:hypothetical protein|nr:DUF6111 family protein [Stellaceae bacterium]
MLRVFLTIVLPLILPTALYLLWLRIARWARREPPPAEDIGWAALPWVWLAGGGALLLAVVLVVVTVNFGTSTSGVYVPPHLENGRIIPGHIEPQRSP